MGEKLVNLPLGDACPVDEQQDALPGLGREVFQPLGRLGRGGGAEEDGTGIAVAIIPKHAVGERCAAGPGRVVEIDPDGMPPLELGVEDPLAGSRSWSAPRRYGGPSRTRRSGRPRRKSLPISRPSGGSSLAFMPTRSISSSSHRSLIAGGVIGMPLLEGSSISCPLGGALGAKRARPWPNWAIGIVKSRAKISGPYPP